MRSRHGSIVSFWGCLRFDAGEIGFDLGADYQYTRYEYAGIDGRNRDLHRLQLPVGFDYRKESWQLDGFIAPGVATSSNVMKDLFDAGSSDDVIVTARMEGMIHAGEHLSWLAGLAYDRAFGRPAAYPVFGALYRPWNHWRFRLAFPDPAIRYSPSTRQRWRVRLFPAGNAWHVVSEELNDDFDYEVESWRAQATWSLGFKNMIWVDLSAGYEFNRRHEFIDDRGSNNCQRCRGSVFRVHRSAPGRCTCPLYQRNRPMIGIRRPADLVNIAGGRKCCRTPMNSFQLRNARQVSGHYVA